MLKCRPTLLRRSLRNVNNFDRMHNLDRVFNLVQKTGDRVVVIPEGGEPYVIMSFDEYEDLVNATVEPPESWSPDAAEFELEAEPGMAASERLTIEPIEVGH